MIRSMTGYGRGEAVDSEYRVLAELKAVNHRYAEILVRMSRELLAFEDLVRKLVASQVKRGRVEIYITLDRLSGSAREVEIDQDLALGMTKAGHELAGQLGLLSDLSVAQLLQFEGVMQVRETQTDPKLVADLLTRAVSDGVQNLLTMRSHEGEQLAADFEVRLGKLADLTRQITDRSPLVVAEYRERLQKRLQEWLDGQVELDESRLITEVAMFAERANIDEELVRLRSHIGQFQAALQVEEPVGRKLDFLVQEMNREVNTIGSKANDLQLSQAVVEAKSLLEQIREQVQNVE